MFRRPGKNPLEKDSLFPLYKEDTSPANYLYGAKKTETEMPQRAFESPVSQPFFPIHEDRVHHEEKPWHNEKTPHLASHPFQAMMKEEPPETTLGEGVTFRGELSFERLLRIDGTFEGELLSQGKVIVGPKGKVKANLNLREAIIEGKVEGNITIQERLELRGHASVVGDIRARSLVVDDGVSIVGRVEITQQQDPTPAV